MKRSKFLSSLIGIPALGLAGFASLKNEKSTIEDENIKPVWLCPQEDKIVAKTIVRVKDIIVGPPYKIKFYDGTTKILDESIDHVHLHNGENAPISAIETKSKYYWKVYVSPQS